MESQGHGARLHPWEGSREARPSHTSHSLVGTVQPGAPTRPRTWDASRTRLPTSLIFLLPPFCCCAGLFSRGRDRVETCAAWGGDTLWSWPRPQSPQAPCDTARAHSGREEASPRSAPPASPVARTGRVRKGWGEGPPAVAAGLTPGPREQDWEGKGLCGKQGTGAPGPARAKGSSAKAPGEELCPPCPSPPPAQAPRKG